jgi:hypothetical protein
VALCQLAENWLRRDSRNNLARILNRTTFHSSQDTAPIPKEEWYIAKVFSLLIVTRLEFDNKGRGCKFFKCWVMCILIIFIVKVSCVILFLDVRCTLLRVWPKTQF